MKLLLRVFKSEGVEVEAAYVEITPAAAKRYIELIELVAKLKEDQKPARVVYLTFWDYSVTYIGGLGDDDDVRDKLDDEEIVELDADWTPPDEGSDGPRTECDMLEVWDDTILWTATMKHGENDDVETVGLNREFLTNIAKEKEAVDE